jgi:hypothetical protein
VKTRLRTPFAALAAVLIAFTLQPRASGQTPELEVFYNKLEPKEQFKYKWKGKEGLANAGVFRWEVPQTEFGTNGLDRNFTGYCAEVLVPITAEKLYRFRVNSLFAPENYGLAKDKENAALAAQRRATYIKELFGRYFRDPTLKSVNADEAIALQIALWEVIQETEPAEGEPKLDLFAGDFQANYPPAEAPAFVTKAQEYLGSLTGNDIVFYENPDLRGRELIRLMGIENAAGVVAQSQFALRFAGGGGVGAITSNPLTAGGGLGAIGGGAPVGGLGAAGAGGGGGLIAGGNPGGGQAFTPPTIPPINVPPTDVPPVDAPPPEQPPTTPVPVPAGVILGVIALGTLGSWRLGARLLHSK